MEELLAFACLLYEDMATTEEYYEALNRLFLDCPENDDLLYLEWETDLKKAVAYIFLHIDYSVLDDERFGRILMNKLTERYKNDSDLKSFANRAYHLWKILPRSIQRKEPFVALCYADDPLSWGDEKQTRDIYESMLNFYNE